MLYLSKVMANQKILSPAMLKTFEQCRKKYFLQYVRNIRMPQTSTPFEKGKNIHAIAGYFLSGVDITKFEKSLTNEENFLWNKLKNNEYFKNSPFKAEFSLNFRIENFWFGGRLDAIVKSNKDYFILDYKTGSAPKDAKYNYQTMIYLIAASRYIKDFETLSFVYIDLKNDQNVVIKSSPELLTEYENKLLKSAKKLTGLTENNLPTKNENCNCEYEKICF